MDEGLAREAIARPPIGLLHGLLGAASSWDEVRARLAHGVRGEPLAIAGHEGPCAPTSFEREVARLAEDARARGLRGLVGYSLGARLALGVAAELALERLWLVSGRDGLADPREAEARRAEDDALAAALERDGLAAFVDAWERRPLFASQARLAEEVRARHRARRLAHDPASVALALRALSLGRMPRVAARALARTPRVSLVVGALDPKFRALAEALVAEHAEARAARGLAPIALHVVPDAGHDVVLERPDVIGALIAEDR